MLVLLSHVDSIVVIHVAFFGIAHFHVFYIPVFDIRVLNFIHVSDLVSLLSPFRNYYLPL